MGAAELFATLLRTRIEHGSIGKNNAGREHHAVAIGMHTAVHARSIVDNNTTHHGRADRCRIGREHASIRLEYLIYTGTNYTRLKTDRLLIGSKLILLPVLAGHNENAVSTALTAKRCTRCTESEGELVLATSANYF